ncbi:hypothetical protein CLV84_1193 [Neolewinella xylanilytica]|uniref:PH (Pleckstrin Homology) domain-containing protein n=2 Tax=Neolewinella xylanilytica TaxID=1514080 RepID=A0A2S6I9R4_9BACT|nr:hypothetical protein CLV84_1193 [Neolewinella xylanilytica]
MESSDNGTATIRRTPNGLAITVPSRKQWFAMIFLPVWLLGWAAGFVAAGGSVIGSLGGGEIPDLFLAVWLILWTAGGVFALSVVSWLWFGKEAFRIEGSRVVYFRGVFGFGMRKELHRGQITNVRYHAVDTSLFSGNRNMAAFGFGEGRIRFDYGMKTFSFGLALDEAEARYLADRIAAEL